MYLSSSSTSSPELPVTESSSPDPSEHNNNIGGGSGGLFVQPRSINGHGAPVRVVVPPDHCAFQVGETAQILSGGLLQATPHAVLRDTNDSSRTRESFAVFLEPEFGAPLDVPAGKTMEDCWGGAGSNPELGLPPLSARWKPGQTFGDFHLATVSAFAVVTDD